MAVPVWPSDLPQRFSRQGFSAGFADGRLFMPMDAGPPKTRRRFSSATKPVQATMLVDTDGVSRFERFWEEETNDGSLPFIVYDQTRHGVPLAAADGTPLADEDGDPILISAPQLAVFGQNPPSVTNEGGPWFRVSFSLVILP